MARVTLPDSEIAVEELCFPKRILNTDEGKIMYVCLQLPGKSLNIFFLGNALGNKWKVQEFEATTALAKEIQAQVIRL